MRFDINNYHTLYEIQVAQNDEIIFPEIDDTYIVRSKYLAVTQHQEETYVLNILKEKGLIKNIRNFCEKCYGYAIRRFPDDIWPECHANDYAALTRIIVTIFELLSDSDTVSISLTPLKNISFLW